MWRLLKLLTVPVQSIMKTWNTRLQFFGYMQFSDWTCKSNHYFSIFSTVQRRLSKAHAINCSCFPTEHKTRYINNKRNNELKLSMTAFPCYSEFICAKIVVHKPLPCLKSASRGCFQSFAGLREREIVVPDEKKFSTQKTYLLITFSQVTVSPILNN